ncbi:PP2C family protein-serine/threonine phosphatase [Embleya sp. NPDC056575]|uniref:PP2C family protein-serine/threonine phosphatase n=1 Tax=unclassified Embleya TaxID=2699296 RepID=UPI0036AB3A1E
MVLRRRLAEFRHPWQTAHALPVLTVVLIVVITVVDLISSPDVHLGPLLVVAPALAASFAGPRLTAGIGALAVGAQVLIAMLRGGLTTRNHLMQVISVAMISALVWYLCLRREQRRREVVRLRSVAEAAQRVLLRPLPRRVGSLRIASFYLAADDEAQIGGDLYALARTDAGIRLIIGDVRGKGLAAVGDAAQLLGAFREGAHRFAALPELAAALEESICRYLAELSSTDADADERFITGIVADLREHDGEGALTTFGHPPPLLLRDGRVHTLDARWPAPPLGLCQGIGAADYVVDTFTLHARDILVLYTDGVIEARAPDGTFYPLTERVARWSGLGPEGLLDHLRHDLPAYVGGRLADDAAVVAIERAPTPPPGRRSYGAAAVSKVAR